jgi:hypothetical protein
VSAIAGMNELARRPDRLGASTPKPPRASSSSTNARALKVAAAAGLVLAAIGGAAMVGSEDREHDE